MMPKPLVKRKYVVKIEYTVETTETSEVVRRRVRANLFNTSSQLRQGLMSCGWVGGYGTVWLTVGKRYYGPSTTSNLSFNEDSLKREAEVKHDEKYLDDYKNKIALQLKRYPETQAQA